MRLERIQGDLLASMLLAIASLVLNLTPLSELPFRMPLGLAMVLFLPGYTLVTALFLRKNDLDGLERMALSFGLSIAVVPLIGLGLNYTPWGIRTTPVVVSLAVFTVSMAAIAYLRRMNIPFDERFSVEFREGIGSLRNALAAGGTGWLDRALTIILLITLITSVFALVYIVVTPKQGEKFTEFYILGPGGKAADYPVRILAGNDSTVIVGVVNHEYAPVNYTMQLSISNSSILNRELTLQHNQTWEEPVTYVLNKTGDQQKLEFSLFKEGNKTLPYRDLHLWVNVSEKIDANTTRLAGSAQSSPEVVTWYAQHIGLDPQEKRQYAEAEGSLKNMLSGGYWKVIARGEPLTEEAGNCKQQYCLVRGIDACTECREMDTLS